MRVRAGLDFDILSCDFVQRLEETVVLMTWALRSGVRHGLQRLDKTLQVSKIRGLGRLNNVTEYNDKGNEGRLGDSPASLSQI